MDQDTPVPLLSFKHISCTSQEVLNLYKASVAERHYPVPGVGGYTTPTESPSRGLAAGLRYLSHIAFSYPDPHIMHG